MATRGAAGARILKLAPLLLYANARELVQQQIQDDDGAINTTRRSVFVENILLRVEELD
jgi:hypothetical protein